MAVAVLLCAAMAPPPKARAGPIPSSLYNEGGAPGIVAPANEDSFTIVFQGDQRANLAPTFGPPPVNDGHNATYVESQEPGNIPIGTGPPTMSYNATNNTTTLVYSGNFIAGDSYHFGYSELTGPGGEKPAPQVLSKFYSVGGNPSPSSNPWLFPAVGIGFGEVSLGAYMIVLAGVGFTAGDGQPFGTGIVYDWAEVPINLPVFVPVIIGNFLNDDIGGLPDNDDIEPDTTLQLSSAQYFISDSQIPLGDLNIDNLPPTDPRFQPLPGFVPGTTLGQGDTVTYTVSPEPSSLTLLVTGVFGVFGYGWRRRKPAATL
jgi:hypothetical protein